MTSIIPTSSGSTALRKRSLFTSSVLILSNLLPLAGILLWGWDAFILLCLYCLETAVIGFWTILRLAAMSRDTGSVAARSTVGTLALAGFFIVHTGLFVTIHMIFLFILFGGHWIGQVHNARDFFKLIVIGKDLWIPLLALFVGQGAIFTNDAVNRFVFAKVTQTNIDAGTLMSNFYNRIVLMHIAILAGGFIAQMIGTMAPLIVLVLLKIALEVRLQMKVRSETP